MIWASRLITLSPQIEEFQRETNNLKLHLNSDKQQKETSKEEEEVFDSNHGRDMYNMYGIG
jgi:hypothetical protein